MIRNMKKILSLAILFVATVLLASCEKDEIGSTATKATAGDWYVTVTAVDDAGKTVYEDADLFGLGRIHMLTFNTNENVADKMYVFDNKAFWNFKVQTTCDQKALTFSTNGAAKNETGDPIDVTITDGKILPGVGHQNNGSPADSIVFYISFSDDTNPAKYGFSKYKVSGIRYSGLTEND